GERVDGPLRGRPRPDVATPRGLDDAWPGATGQLAGDLAGAAPAELDGDGCVVPGGGDGGAQVGQPPEEVLLGAAGPGADVAGADGQAAGVDVAQRAEDDLGEVVAHHGDAHPRAHAEAQGLCGELVGHGALSVLRTEGGLPETQQMRLVAPCAGMIQIRFYGRS